MVNMKDKNTEQMREYLRLKNIQENDKSDEIIEEVYNEVATEEDEKIGER